MFDGGDIVSVHTLAAAAATVFRNLLEDTGEDTWTDAIIEAFPGGKKQARQLLRKAQNFFKHADKDPHEEIDFDEVTNDEAMIIATLDYGELLGRKKTNEKLSTPMSVFQMWYFAKAPEIFEASKENEELTAKFRQCFPNLGDYPRFQQLAMGADFLKKRLAEKQPK